MRLPAPAPAVPVDALAGVRCDSGDQIHARAFEQARNNEVAASIAAVAAMRARGEGYGVRTLQG